MLTKTDNYYCDREAVKEAWKFNEYDIARAEDGSYKYNGNTKMVMIPIARIITETPIVPDSR